MARVVRLRTGLLVSFVFVAWLGSHSAWTISTGLRAQPQPSDVAVVLGTRVLPSGVPSFWLRARLNRAFELYQNNLVKNIIVSGGLGREGHEEADVMRAYLIERGIPSERIFLDLNGDDTFATARHTKQIMASSKFHSVVIVSHYYHLPRARLTFQRFGIPNVSATGVQTNPLWQDGGNLAREFAAFYFYVLRSYAAT
jgi:vancomycin permeability regulator SanA